MRMMSFSFSAGFLTKKKYLGKYTSFLLKFLFFSTLLYLLWTLIAPTYFSAVLKITTAYFELIGFSLELNLTPDLLYSQGIRSCIPPFIVLVLATPKIKWKNFSIRNL
jgi:hypothetical protein